MKKMLFVLVTVLAPSSSFALIGFGIQAGSDLSKLGPYSFSEGSGLTQVTVNAYEMEANPAGIGAYAFVDLFGFALEGKPESNISTKDFGPYTFWAIENEKIVRERKMNCLGNIC